MLDVLERFELESADRGHGAFFPDNQLQLPTIEVSQRLGPGKFWGPAAARSKDVLLAFKGRQEAPSEGWVGRDLEDQAIASLPTSAG